MARELTPWERLDGVKHSLNFTNAALDSIIEGAVEWERSRIIKLLIDKAIEWRIADLHQQANYIDFAIALIKGEQKKTPPQAKLRCGVNGCDCEGEQK